MLNLTKIISYQMKHLFVKIEPDRGINANMRPKYHPIEINLMIGII